MLYTPENPQKRTMMGLYIKGEICIHIPQNPEIPLQTITSENESLYLYKEHICA